MKKTTALVAQFFAITYVTSEYNFYEKNPRNFIDSILGNNLHN